MNAPLILLVLAVTKAGDSFVTVAVLALSVGSFLVIARLFKK
jgi:hypothetical protein